MTRSASSALGALAVAALAVGGCAFADGDPWGRLELDLAARFDASPDRVVAGALKTARNYLVSLDAAELTVASITVSQRAAGAAGAFDPADPPAGYTLCHNGHCHADDGRLVAYAEIAAELAGGGAAVGPSLSVPAADQATALPVAPAALGSPAAVALGGCPGGCAFGRGDLDALAVRVTALHLRGTVHDELTGDAARLPPEGRAFDVVVTPADLVTEPLAGAFDKGEPVGLRVHAVLALPAAFFDPIDWATVADADLPGALDSAFGEHAGLEVTASRFD